MKNKTRIWLLLPFFLLMFSSSAFSQSLYLEPVFTSGRENTLIINENIQGEKLWYIINLFQQDKHTLFGEFSGEIITYQHVGDWPYLEHGKKYGFYFKVDTIPGSDTSYATSNTVFSIQDNNPPDRKFQRFLQPLNDHWFNQQTFELEYRFVDSAGIDSVFLFSRIKNQPWKNKPDTANYYAISDSSKDPVEVAVIDKVDKFEITVDEDNYYEFYLGAKDAAHHPMSCAKKWILNGNKDVPDSSSDPHLWIKIDTKEPYSEIIGLKEYYNDLNFDINYTAYDPIIANGGSCSSGLNLVLLYYIFNNNTIFVAKDIFDSIDGIFHFHAPQEGSYVFFTRAFDQALNAQSNINIVGTTVDTTRPLIKNFILSDILLTPTKFKAFADKGWTKDLTVGANIEADIDNLSGLDSIFFAGDIDMNDVFSEFIISTLTDGEGNKAVTCQVTDKARNFSLPVIYNIIFDKTPPELTSILLMDYNGTDIEKTNELKVRVIPQVADINDTTISHIALFENSEIDPVDREKLWQTFSPGDAIVYDKFQEGPAPRWLKLYAVIRDHAGNVSNMVVDSIEYVPKLAIGGLSLEDLDGEVKNSKGEKFTDNLGVYAIISGISRDPGDIAYFEFAKDCSFLEPTVKTDYNAPQIEDIDYSTKKVPLDLKELNHNGTNELKEVCVRLVSTTLVETTQAVSDNIFLDTTPPVFGKPGLILKDITEFVIDDPIKLNFNPASGWTNELNINAHILDCSDNLSGCDRLRFWGDVAETDVPFEKTVPLTLLIETTSPQEVYVSARDSVGNWSDGIMATIILDNDPPSIEILNPHQGIKLIQRDPLPVEVQVKDLFDLKNLSKIWYGEEGCVDYNFIETRNQQSKIVSLAVPVSLEKEEKTICVVAVDSAGNHSGKVTCTINFISDFDTLGERVRNVPNPFNPSDNNNTKIIVTSDQENAEVTVKIYDVFGNLVRSWPNNRIINEQCEFEWNGKNGEGIAVGEGAYICIARIGSNIIKKTKIGVLRR